MSYTVGMRLFLILLTLTATAAADQAPTTKPTRLEIAVTKKGFEPESVTVPAGKPVTLVFTRKTERTCATAAIFDQIDKKVDLPLHQSVRVDLATGKIRVL